ncbi:IS3 family transposase [Oceanobacillus sp. J11TS1]
MQMSNSNLQFYNYKRIHSTIGYMSPIAYEKMYLCKIVS